MNPQDDHRLRELLRGARQLAVNLQTLRSSVDARDSKRTAEALDGVFHVYMVSIAPNQTDVRDALEMSAGGRNRSQAMTHADRALKILTLAFDGHIPPLHPYPIRENLNGEFGRATVTRVSRLLLPDDVSDSIVDSAKDALLSTTYVGERLAEGVQRLFSKAMDVGAVVPEYDWETVVAEIHDEENRIMCAADKETTVVAVSKPVAELPNIDNESAAIAIMLDDRSLSIRQIAKKVGVSRQVPYEWPKFREIAEKLGVMKPRGPKTIEGRLHKGFKSDGRIEAIDDLSYDDN